MNYVSKLWKQDRLPVWHAGLSESTIYKIESESQSTNILYTGWTLPDSSPFIHSLLRDVLQNQALPVLMVFARASLLAYASIRTEQGNCSLLLLRIDKLLMHRSDIYLFVFSLFLL